MNISQIKQIIYEEVTNVLLDLDDPFMLSESVYYSLLTEGDLDGEPMTPNELRDLLRKKVVNFEFIKLNGEHRPATGTLRMDMIPSSKHPKGIRPSNKDKTVTYFDLDKDDWRSVSTRTSGVVLKDVEGKEATVVITDEPLDNQVKIEDEPQDDEVIITDEPQDDEGDVIITEPEDEIPSEEIEEVPEEPTEEPSEEVPEEPIEDETEPTEDETEPTETPSDIVTDEDGENTVMVNKELKHDLPKQDLKIDKDGKGVYRLGKTIPNKKGYVKDGTYRNPIKIRLRNKKDLDRIKNSKFGENTKKTENDLRLENPDINNPFENRPKERDIKQTDNSIEGKQNNDLSQDIHDDKLKIHNKDIDDIKDSKFESVKYENINNLKHIMSEMNNMLCKLI